MPLTRFKNIRKIDNNRAIGTSHKRVDIYNAVQNNTLQTEFYITKEGDRLDRLAGTYYNDGTLWWVIAAANGIGWWLQLFYKFRLILNKFLLFSEAFYGYNNYSFSRSL